jgi:hypothetical protein
MGSVVGSFMGSSLPFGRLAERHDGGDDHDDGDHERWQPPGRNGGAEQEEPAPRSSR